MCEENLSDASGKNINRIALIGIIVENPDSVDELNKILHAYNDFIIGRMGVPYKKQHLAIISVIVDAPGDVIGSLAGKLGMLNGVSVKTVYSKTQQKITER